MRVDLKVPYEEKDSAKRLGARWDVARKTWYVLNVEDLTPFMRWVGGRLAEPHKAAPHHHPRHHKRTGRGVRFKHERIDSLPPVETKATDLSLPACECSTPPWEHCEHTIKH